MKKGFSTITYDLRGRGGSDKPINGYGIENHINDLKSILDYYNIGKSIILAHSFGAMIAVRFAISYPEKLRAMILMDGGGLLKIRKRIQLLDVLKPSFDR
ncbi:MAG: alpha/beta fold hydrolase, partial [Leptospiraceae bacterium]|nr:alpha/beta fold hydrolase [Leptospiraceae bacterium]